MSTARALLLQRLLEINRSGRFGQSVQFSHIRDEAEVAGIERAVAALEQLQRETAEVLDPVDYLRRAIFAPTLLPPPPSDDQDQDEDQDRQGQQEVDEWEQQPHHHQQLEEEEAEAEQEPEEEPLERVVLKREPHEGREVVNAPPAKRSRGLIVKQELQTEAEADAGEQALGAGLAPAHHISPQDDSKVKTQDGEDQGEFSESQLLERYMAFLNEKKCKVYLDPAETLPVLDCVGYKHAMKVLQTFEASSATLDEPLEFIKDLVARSTWIWVTPGMLPEDDKVARRIAWLNLFGNLKKPIVYSEIANGIDRLRVPHAMVLLRELEAQAQVEEIEDPTDFLRRAVRVAGGSSRGRGASGEEEGEEGEEGHLMACPVVPPVSVAQMVAGVNSSGRLYKKLDPAEVSGLAAGLPEETVSSLLEELINKGSKVKDPAGFLKFKLKALHAARSSASQ